MKSRRQQYRHEFPPTRPMRVRLQSTQSRVAITADLINLSIGGMCVYASALQKHAGEQWEVALSFESDGEPLTVAAETVYHRSDDPAICGFRFAPESDEEKAAERERAIWKFLLDEQCRKRNWLR